MIPFIITNHNKNKIEVVEEYDEKYKVMRIDVKELNSQQPDVKSIAHQNGEGEVAGEVHKPVGVNRGGVTQYPSSDIRCAKRGRSDE